MRQKFLLLLLCAGSMLCAQTSPGGISGACLWLKAGEGVTTDVQNNVTEWKDLTGKNKFNIIQADPKNPSSPVLIQDVANGNPAISMNGKVALEGDASGKFVSIFCVHQARPTKSGFRSSAISFKEDGVNGYSTASWNLTFFYTTAVTSGGTTSNYVYVQDGSAVWTSAATNVVDKIYNFSSWFGGFGYDIDLITTNGGAQLAANNRFKARTFTGKPYIGVTYNMGRTPELIDYLDGEIAEVIAFDRIITDNERFQIESYLALKYGLTECKYTVGSKTSTPNNADRYAFDYTLSDGTIAWNGSSAELKPYSHYVAAIVRDNGSGLLQNRSTGRHGYMLAIEDGILSIANGDSFDSPSPITTDKQYALVGATNNKITDTELKTFSNYDTIFSLLKRNWTVKTNGISTISLQIKLNDLLTDMVNPEVLSLIHKRGDVHTRITGIYSTKNRTATFDNIQIEDNDQFFLVANTFSRSEIITPSQTVCQNGSPIKLVASLTGGVWSGEGVINDTFSPEGLAQGNYKVTYEFMNEIDEITFDVVNSLTDVSFDLKSNIENINDNYLSIVVTAVSNFVDPAIQYEFSLDDPNFEMPMQELSSNNTFRLAGYLLSDGDHLVSARMVAGPSDAQPCMGPVKSTATLVLNKTNNIFKIKESQYKISIFPVPAESELFVCGLPTDKNLVIEITDNLGRSLLMHQPTKGDECTTLNVRHLEGGSLFVSVYEKESGKKLHGQQVIK